MSTSTLIVNSVQLGQNITPGLNWTIRNTEIGSLYFSVGNAGATTLDVLVLDNTGNLTFPSTMNVARTDISNVFNAAQVGQPYALSIVTNAVAIDMSLSNNFSLALQATTGQTLGNPTNMVAGQSGQLAITQNATPSTLAYDTYWISTDGTAMAVSATANAVNLLTYYVVDSTHIWFGLSKHGVA
jgi:hypothetical protein